MIKKTTLALFVTMISSLTYCGNQYFPASARFLQFPNTQLSSIQKANALLSYMTTTIERISFSSELNNPTKKFYIENGINAAQEHLKTMSLHPKKRAFFLHELDTLKNKSLNEVDRCSYDKLFN